MEHFFSIFFVLGLIVTAAYAWQRFNEPSFPNQAALPKTLVPLRYLFLKAAYRRARFTYLAVSLLLYCVLVWPGPKIVPFLGLVGVEKFPAEGWALLVALFLVGFVPNSQLKWLSAIEDLLRRSVHAWFLVPDGVEKTIGVLEDTSFEPPSGRYDAMPPALRDKVRQDLKLQPGTLQYRWARTAFLMALLQQMGAGASNPLKKASFDPFQADFEDIRTNYKALELELGPYGKEVEPLDSADALKPSVDHLLQHIYAYISWGVRNQADSEQDVDDILADLGFRIPSTSGQRLFDIVAIPIFAVCAITTIFWVLAYIALNLTGAFSLISQEELPFSDIVAFALIYGLAAALMYGGAISIALKQRQSQIEQKKWREGSPTCLIPIAVRAGLVTWAVIVSMSVLSQPNVVLQSLVAITHMIKSFAASEPGAAAAADWKSLPVVIATALPWFLAGATVSILLATMVGRDIQRMSLRRRAGDALRLGLSLGAAAAAAQLMQTALTVELVGGGPPYELVPFVGLAGAACGAVIGFLVPQGCRTNLVSPSDRTMAYALQELLGRAERSLGSKEAAEQWAFGARMELGGITPAEAVQYKGLATSVHRLLGESTPVNADDVLPSSTARPVVIQGGLGGG